MKAVILAGGLGTRLSEATRAIPKPMVEIGGRPIIWHIMNIFSAHGVRDFIVCCGYRGYVLKEFFANYALHTSDVTFDIASGTETVHRREAEPWKVTLVDTGDKTMTGGRLKRIASYVKDGPFFMTYGDGLADVDLGALRAFHESQGTLATVTAVRPPARWGVLELRGARVTSFREKVGTEEDLINGGFFVLDPRALDYIDGDSTAWEAAPLERLAREGQLSARRHYGFWQAMDTLRDRMVLDEMWTSGNAPWKVWR